MKIEVNDNLKWFLESLINEGFENFYIDDMYGTVFTGPKKEFNPNVNFLTSEMFKAYSKLKENTVYSIKDFANGEIDEHNFKFGDKVILVEGNKEHECIYLKSKGANHVIVTPELIMVTVPSRYIKAKKG